MRTVLARNTSSCAKVTVLLLTGLLLVGVGRSQPSPSPTQLVLGCNARYVRIENTPGVANQNWY